MPIWRRKNRETAIEVESVRRDLLARVANLEAQLSSSIRSIDELSATVQSVMHRDKQVSKLRTGLTELEGVVDSTRQYVGERIEQLSSSVQAAHRANAGKSGGRGRGVNREAAQIGEEVLTAMQTPEGIQGLISQLESRLAAAGGQDRSYNGDSVGPAV